MNAIITAPTIMSMFMNLTTDVENNKFCYNAEMEDNLRREVESSRFDPTRQSFIIHPDDHGIRTRKAVKSKAKKHDMFFAIDGVVKRDGPVPDTPHSIHIIRRNGDTDE